MSLYRHHKNFLVFITAIASITGLLIGLDTGIIGGSQYFIYRDFQVSSTLLEALTVAAVPIGALLGAILSAKMAVYYGRKNRCCYLF